VKQYEYCEISEALMTLERRARKLTEMGDQGWQLICCYQGWMIFKREKA